MMIRPSVASIGKNRRLTRGPGGLARRGRILDLLHRH